MPHIARDEASQVEEIEGFEGRYQQLGGYTVGFERYSADAPVDALAPLFRGLPDDRCQSPHWGVVLKGRIAYRHADGTEEVIDAGQAYYVPPGHLPGFFAGAEIVEFSPTADFAKTIEVVLGNLAASGT